MYTVDMNVPLGVILFFIASMLLPLWITFLALMVLVVLKGLSPWWVLVMGTWLDVLYGITFTILSFPLPLFITIALVATPFLFMLRKRLHINSL
jgi:hypothetical protein